MMGLVLWYNPDPGVGMVWCEDQGPLAYVGPNTRLPGAAQRLVAGDQLVFSYELHDGVRFVRDIFSLTQGHGGRDPRDIIDSFHQIGEAEKNLKIVA